MENISEVMTLEERREYLQVEIRNLYEALKPIVDAAMQMWSAIVPVVEKVVERIGEIEATHDWIIDWDIRKKSLVMSNRPKFMFRKIIR